MSKQARWCKAYVGFVRDHRLSAGARLLLVILRSYCPANRSTCYPSNETLASDLGCQRRQLSRYLVELESKRWIKRRHRRRRDQAFASTFYDLLDERKSMMKEAFPVGHKSPTATIEEQEDVKYSIAKPLRAKIIRFP